jgi:hypothetical protein
MSDEELTYTQKIIYSPKYNWDECAIGNWYSHRENINSALWEFSSRNEETRKICFGFGNPIIVTGNVHYSKEDILLGKTDAYYPHFNIESGGKTFHIYVTKNHRRIVQISEMTVTKHPF